MTRHKADQKVSRNVVDPPDQVGKIYVFRQIFSVGIDVLPQQGDVLISFLHQAPGFCYDIVRFPGPFPSPHIGDDTVSTEIVAPVHDAQPSFGSAVSLLRNTFRNCALRRIRCKDAFFCLHDGLQQFRKPPQLVRTKYHVHDRIGLFQFCRHMFLLYHTAADGHDLIRFFLFCMDQRSHVSVNALLCVLPDRTGVDHDHVGLKFILRELISHLFQIPSDLLTVRLVLLTSVGVHHRQGRPVGCAYRLMYLPTDPFLFLDLLLRDFSSLCCHVLIRFLY